MYAGGDFGGGGMTIRLSRWLGLGPAPLPPPLPLPWEGPGVVGPGGIGGKGGEGGQGGEDGDEAVEEALESVVASRGGQDLFVAKWDRCVLNPKP